MYEYSVKPPFMVVALSVMDYLFLIFANQIMILVPFLLLQIIMLVSMLHLAILVKKE